jgi:hypothetical protein
VVWSRVEVEPEALRMVAEQGGLPAEVSAVVEQVYRRARAQYGAH